MGSDSVRVSRFEDLVIWQMGRGLTKTVYAMTCNALCTKDYVFCDQMRRAAISIMNNIAEGYERGSNRDFMRFLFIARGSCGELRSMLYVARDQNYIDQDEFLRLTEESRRCSAAIWGLIKSLGKSSNWIERTHLALLVLLYSVTLQPCTHATL